MRCLCKLPRMNLSSPNSLLRAILAALVTLVAAVLILLLLASADTALSVWQRLREIPTGLAVAYAVLLSVIGLAAGWLVWRLLHPRARAARPAPHLPDGNDQAQTLCGAWVCSAAAARRARGRPAHRRRGSCPERSLPTGAPRPLA